MKNPLAQLGDFGQSVWLDDISRGLVSGGVLETLIAQDGLSGVTSNPTIFSRSISSGSEYDKDIKMLTAKGKSPSEIRESLIVQDIASAADTLAPVFESTGGRDGWVSIEVDPRYARDTEKTIAEAERIKGLVARPNAMIKVPATPEGVLAVRELISRGLCINVTLIFSLERYAEVLEAYLSGLEHLQVRLGNGEQLPQLSEVRSVASFFVSRIDTAVDKRIDTCGLPAGLRGKAAVASAKRAYRVFQETFFGGRWDSLKADGAHLQRPLWASTSTKDPSYSDILYVQELIGANTVNTMPQKTLGAFRDHGRPEETVATGVHAAAEHMKALGEAGIDMEEVEAELEREGVKAFTDSFDELRETIANKSEQDG